MGFTQQNVERAILYLGCRTVEECLPYLIYNESNVMEHRFISPKQAFSEMDGEDFKHNYHTAQAIYCIICQKKRKKQEQKTVKQVNETFFSRQNSRKFRGINDNNDSDMEPTESKVDNDANCGTGGAVNPT